MKKNLPILLVVMTLLGAILACGDDAAYTDAESPSSDTAPAALEGNLYMPGASNASESDMGIIEPVINNVVPAFSGVAGESIVGYDAYLMPANTTWEDVVTFYNFPQAVNIDGFDNGVMAMVNGGGVTTPLPDMGVLIYIPLDDKVIVVIVYTE